MAQFLNNYNKKKTIVLNIRKMCVFVFQRKMCNKYSTLSTDVYYQAQMILYPFLIYSHLIDQHKRTHFNISLNFGTIITRTLSGLPLLSEHREIP